ncbi:MAG TPA: hypothetical protein VFB44_15580 [Thermoleophilaceae bacterium]|nr:hypothetical protein [Thermoleophilaceae bacterium]
MEARSQEPKRIWWARPRKLCGLERPGGGGRSHRPERRDAEIAYLVARGVRLCVSTMPTRHNLAAYEAAGLECHHVPMGGTADGAAALDELLPLLRRRLRSPGAVAVHGNRYTDFAAAVCAGHLHDVRGIAPADALASAARAGLTVTPAACALLGVVPGEVQERLQASRSRA